MSSIGFSGDNYAGNYATYAALVAGEPVGAVAAGRLATVGVPGGTTTHYVCNGATWNPLLPATLDALGNVIGLMFGNGTSFSLVPLLFSTCPVGIACTGSVAANGALTLGTALNATYSGGIFLYLPAGAAYAGSVAGLYYCVMSSTTLGTIYDNISTGIPTKPATPTPIVAAGPGAYTAPTGSPLALITAADIPAGSLGTTGGLRAELFGSNFNSAGAKTTRLTLAGALAGGAATTTSVNNSQVITFQNVGAADKNIVFFQNFGASAIGQARSVTTINTAAAVPMVVTGQLAVATDWVIVDTAVVNYLGNV